MELTLFSERIITNNKLNAEIIVIKNCMTSNLINGWEMAMALANIKDNDLFESDFENFKEFCELVLNKSQAQVNRVINAVHISNESQFVLAKKYTVTQVCELAPLGVDLIDSLLSDDLIDNTMTCKELRQIVKDQKALEKSEEITEDKEDKEELDSLALWLSSCPYQLTEIQYRTILELFN